jgi:hypothetical protein
MNRQSGFLPSVAVLCVVSLAMGWTAITLAQTPSETPAPAPAAPAPVRPAPAVPAPSIPLPAGAPGDAAGAARPELPAPGSLPDMVDTFWHYGRIARYDLAAAAGKSILASNPDPRVLLDTFEAVVVANNRNDDLDATLLKWQSPEIKNPQMHDVVTQIIAVLAKGHFSRRADPTYIEENLTRMAVNERGYLAGLQRLRDSGELAVPVMIDDLRNRARTNLHATIRRALRDLGRISLNPLLAATAIKDNDTLIDIVTALGAIGYDVSDPYLLRISRDNTRPAELHTAALDALRHCGVADPAKLDLASAFYNLAERFYTNTSSMSGTGDTGFVWNWDESKGLMRTDVPSAIFGDLMAMRECRNTLAADPNRADAISLWLVADNKRETDLPPGARDATRQPTEPDAHFFNVSAGVQYLNPALARAMKDRNSAVSLKLVQALTQIVGQSSLNLSQTQPVIQAMEFPDRLVRYEAAMGLAGSLPDKPFVGQERVVPLLAEALGQTGQTNVLLIDNNLDALNDLRAQLAPLGFGLASGTTVENAIDAAQTLSAVDCIVIAADIDIGSIDRLMALSAQSPKLASAAKLVIANEASPLAQRAATNPLLSLSNGQPIPTAIAAARERAGLLPLSPQEADSYAIRAAVLLGDLIVGRGQVFDLSPARAPLLNALSDSRADVVVAAGADLSLIKGRDIQESLLEHAADTTKLATLPRMALYGDLATNARQFGCSLQESDIEILQGAVATEADPAAKTCAAAALGALNLPPKEPAKLILNPPKLSLPATPPAPVTPEPTTPVPPAPAPERTTPVAPAPVTPVPPAPTPIPTPPAGGSVTPPSQPGATPPSTTKGSGWLNSIFGG